LPSWRCALERGGLIVAWYNEGNEFCAGMRRASESGMLNVSVFIGISSAIQSGEGSL